MLRASFVIALALGCAGCTPRPKTSSMDADANAPAARSITSRGTPLVLGVEHSIEDAAWLPNGHLLGASHREVFEVDPETARVRRVPVERPISMLYGARGAKRFVLAHESGATIWNAEALEPIKTLDDVSLPVLSSDGQLLAVSTCDPAGNCSQRIIDLATGDTRATIPAPGLKGDAGELSFSEDGRFALVSARGGALSVIDTSNGKVIVRRASKRLSEGGSALEAAVFRGDRVFMTSDRGVEAIALPSGKVVGRIADPFAGIGMFSSGADAKGSRFALYSPVKERLVVWTVEPSTTKTVKVPDAAPCESNDLVLGDDLTRVVVHGQTIVLATGALEGDAGTPTCADPRFPSKRFDLATKGECRLVDRASHRVVLEHAALCGSNPLSQRAPGFRADDRYFASLFEGAAHIFDLATGKPIAGIGSLATAHIDQLRGLSIVAEVPGFGAGAKRLWLTKKPAPTPPPIPPGFRSATVTETHSFAVRQENGKRTVVAVDRSGKEVLHEELPTFDETIMASRDTAYLRAADGSDFECIVGKGCSKKELHGYIGSFDYPWLLLGTRAQPRDTEPPRLVDITTQRTLPFPKVCGDPFEAKVFRDGPTVLCPRPVMQLVGGDGGTTRITLPDTAPHNTSIAGRVGPMLFFKSVLNAGLAPAYRYDIRSNERAEIFLGTQHAIVRFADGKIERFGDDASSAASVVCVDGADVLPWSACSGAHEITGRFDQ